MSAPPGYRLRQAVNIAALGAAGLCALLTVGVLFGLLGYIVYHGIAGLSWDFLTKLPKPVGEEGGGMANAIVGSLKLLFLAGLIGIPIGFLGGVYLAEFGRGKLGFFVRYAADVLAGCPPSWSGSSSTPWWCCPCAASRPWRAVWRSAS